MLIFSFPYLAHAAGTGDDPRPIMDVPTKEQLKYLEKEERLFKDWVESKNETVSIKVTDAPYKFLWTPTKYQERSYWCGPATCQIVGSYCRVNLSQSTWASLLGTTQDGTVFSYVDDVLTSQLKQKGITYVLCISNYYV